jgi:hypothetical protein
MQFVFLLIPSSSLKLQTYLFALRLPIESTDNGFQHLLSLYIFVSALPLYILSLYIIKKLIDIFNPLLTGNTPFTQKSVSIIKQIGYSCWIYAVIKTVVEYIGAQLLLHSSRYSVPDWNTELTLPVTMLFAGLLVLAFGEVFKQGLALKEDNDSIL